MLSSIPLGAFNFGMSSSIGCEEWRWDVPPTMMHQTKRSKRYVICAPLRYRIRGERVWHSGVCRDMSASGILFESSAALGPGAQFEMHLTLAQTFGERKETSIRFHGTILRSPERAVWAARIYGRRLRPVSVAAP
jgi:hypothetical protein